MVKRASSTGKEQAVARKESRRRTSEELRGIPSTIKLDLRRPRSSKSEELRRIGIFLAKNNLNISTLKSLTRFKTLLDKENISVKELKNSLSLLKTYGITLPDFASLIKNTEALKAKYGKPYSAIVEDYESKMEKVAKATASLKEMEDEERDLEARISNLRNLEALQSVLSKKSVEAESITEYIEQYERFVQFGLDVNTVKMIAEELRRLKFDPKEAGKIVGSWLRKNRTISEALLRAENKLEATKKEEALSIARIKSLDRKAEEAQKKIDSLEGYYVRRSERLESEYETREHALHMRVGEERSRAEAELFDILRERDKLRSENLALKEEVEPIRKEIELARSISTIIRDPATLSSSQLDTLVLEFGKAKETRGRDEVGSSASSERLIEARRALVSALRDLPSLQNNTKPQP